MTVAELMLILLQRDPDEEVFAHADSPGRAQIYGTVSSVSPRTGNIQETWLRVEHRAAVDPTCHTYLDPARRQQRRDEER